MNLRELAEKAAAEWGLPKEVVCALCEAESGWNPNAVRAERSYRYNWDVERDRPFRKLSSYEIGSEFPPADFSAPPGCSRTTEWWQQDMSWGLMQVMGATARELGCKEAFMTVLCNPEIGIWYGCCAFRRYYDMFAGDVRKCVSAYNGGIRAASATPFLNQEYVDKVMALADAYKGG